MGRPCVTKMSLWAIGTPVSDRASPRPRRSSAASACGQAGGGVERQESAKMFERRNPREQMLHQFAARHLPRRQRATEVGHAHRMQGRHHSTTLGTRNNPSSTAGALAWLSVALIGFGDAVVAQPQRHGLHRRQRRVQRLDAAGVDGRHALDDAEEAVQLGRASRPVRRSTDRAAPAARCGSHPRGSATWKGSGTESRNAARRGVWRRCSRLWKRVDTVLSPVIPHSPPGVPWPQHARCCAVAAETIFAAARDRRMPWARHRTPSTRRAGRARFGAAGAPVTRMPR